MKKDIKNTVRIFGIITMVLSFIVIFGNLIFNKFNDLFILGFISLIIGTTAMIMGSNLKKIRGMWIFLMLLSTIMYAISFLSFAQMIFNKDSILFLFIGLFSLIICNLAYGLAEDTKEDQELYKFLGGD